VPELPEVETVRRSLVFRLAGRVITEVFVYRPGVVAHPLPQDFELALVGQIFDSRSLRRGKYLLLGLASGAWLGVHLRMSGRLILRDPPLPEVGGHLRVSLALGDGSWLYFHDPRAFGRLWYVAPDQAVEQVIPALARLGPEPEQLDPTALQAWLARKTIPIKTALLDQTGIAGLGNIYADEVLFRARLHPLTPANQVPGIEQLVVHIQQVLTAAVAAGGTTLRDYSDGWGLKGNFQAQLLAYGRTGQPCVRCGTALTRLKVGGRSSHFCPSCQPAP